MVFSTASLRFSRVHAEGKEGNRQWTRIKANRNHLFQPSPGLFEPDQMPESFFLSQSTDAKNCGLTGHFTRRWVKTPMFGLMQQGKALATAREFRGNLRLPLDSEKTLKFVADRDRSGVLGLGRTQRGPISTIQTV